MLQMDKEGSTKSNITQGIKAMMAVLLILLISALAGKYVLNAFGISMDAFKVVGGIVLAFIGFQMLAGSKNSSGNGDQKEGLMPLIMFAASPGSITMVITLAAVHNPDGIPVSAIIGTTAAVLITMVISVLMLLLSKKKKSAGSGIVSKFMGLIIVAMGMQFLLDGIKHFFGF